MSGVWILGALILAVVIGLLFLLFAQKRRLDQALLSQQSQQNLQIVQQRIEHLESRFQSSVEALQAALRESLGQVDQRLHQATSQVDSKLSDFQKAQERIAETLGGLRSTHEELSSRVADLSQLKTMLGPPKVRGGMGETMLEQLLAMVFSPEQYETQHEFSTGDKVDAVIRLRLPGQKKTMLIPVDAKFPLDNFRRMLETSEDSARAACRKDFLKDVRKHVDAIADKYILPDEGTMDFALMYIPAENVYYEAIVREEGTDGERAMWHYAVQKKVFPVSPNSLYAYLLTIALGLKGMRIEEQAGQVLEGLKRLAGDLGRFREDFELIGKHMGNALKNYQSAEKRLDRVADHLESLGSAAAPAEIPHSSAPMLEKAE